MAIDLLFEKLWEDYGRLNPMAHKVKELFEAEGEIVLNDHVAFRTFDHPAVNLDKMKVFFEQAGYEKKGEYHFAGKKLFAIHMEPKDLKQPKVFISHLLTEKLSNHAQDIIQHLVEQVPNGFTVNENFLYAGRPWNIAYTDYRALLQESEYAAWMSAFGFRANHFTVNVNALKKYPTIEQVNAFLKNHGYAINSSGGEIKGSAEVYLEQSSTLANKVEVEFLDGTFEIPSVYYEFARRYPMADGQLYQGFVERSADKIFESTDSQKES